MHIAFITPEYPHPRVAKAAGIGTSIKNVITALQQHTTEKLQFTLFIYGQQEQAQFEEDGINFHLIKKRSYRFGGFYWYRKHINHYVKTIVKKTAIDLSLIHI